VLMIGHSQRYIPRYRRAHEVVRSGALGRILQVQASLGHSGPLDWRPLGTWFITPELAGRGVIGDQAVHIADTLRYLTGQEAKTIAAFDASFRHKEVEDNAVAVLRLSAGTLATISTSWTMRGTALDQFVLVGEEGTLRVGSESGCPLVLVTASGERHEYSVPDGIPEVGGALQLDEVPEFVETILGERANPIPPEDGYRALEICIAMERSAQSGQFVQLPLGD